MDASYLLRSALQRHRSGDLAAAEPLYHRILAGQPDHAEALYLLGSLHAQRGQADSAIEHLRRALALDPRLAEARNNLANLLAARGEAEEAVGHYRAALDIRPENPEALRNLGLVLQSLDRHDEAVPHLERAVRLCRNDAEGWNALGISLRAIGRTEEAAEAYRRTVTLAPHAAEAHNNLGNALEDLGRRTEAEAHLRRAIALRPDYAEAHGNLGIVLQGLERLDEAKRCYDHALALRPELNRLRGNRAWITLLDGDLRAGFADYEHRFACGVLTERQFPQPRWRGEPLGGRTILIHAEQGLGDTLQFVRYLPMVKARGGRVLFECQPALLGLLRSVTGADAVVARRPDERVEEPFDLHAPLMSLPHLFGTELATIPAEIPYIQPDPDRLAHWRERLCGDSGLRAGLVWAGNPEFRNNHNRSVPLAALAPFATVPGLKLYVLQMGDHALARAEPPPGLALTYLRDDIRDFEDTAAAICCLDLLITVCTSAAHLSGALGRPTWTLLHSNADWRWFRHREDSPWYPTMRLWRQPRPGDWAEVVERVAAELRRRCE